MGFGKNDNIDGPIAFSPTSLSDTLVTSFEAANQQTSFAVRAAKRDAYERYISVLRENGLKPPTSPYQRNPRQTRQVDEEVAVERWHQQVDALIHPSSQLQNKSHADLLEDAAAERENVRQRREEAARGESGLIGGVAAFAGSMAGATTDPLVISTLPMGAPWATGILRTVLTEAVIGGVSEVGVQTLFQTQRGELGEESSIAEAAANIGLAATGAGLFGGAVKGAAKGIGAARKLYLDRQKRILEASRALPDELRTTEVRTAEDILERELEAEAINPLEGEAGRAEHMARMTQAEQLMATDQPVDIGPPASAVRPAEPRPVDPGTAQHPDVSDALDPILERTIALGREVRESMETGQPVGRFVPLMEEPPTPEERLIGSIEEEIEVIDLEVEAELQRMLAEEADTRVHLGDADNLQETTIRDAYERLDNETADLEAIRLCGAF